MFKNLNLFQTANAMARHAAHTQAISARNIANADTPGYRAAQVQPFSETVKSHYGALRTSRAGHISDDGALVSTRSMTSQGFRDPNGNSVSIEEEMVTSVNAARDHEKALAIYRHGLTVLRTAIGRH